MSVPTRLLLITIALSVWGGSAFLLGQEPGCYNNCGAPIEKSVYRLSTSECSARWPYDVGTMYSGSYTVTVFYDVAFQTSDTGSTDQEQTYSPNASGACARWGDPSNPPQSGQEIDCDPYWYSTTANVACVDEGNAYYQANVRVGLLSSIGGGGGVPDCALAPQSSIAAFFGFEPEQCTPCPSQNDFNCDTDVDFCTYNGGCPPDFFPDDNDACCLID